jgi:hypothetical protein
LKLAAYYHDKIGNMHGVQPYIFDTWLYSRTLKKAGFGIKQIKDGWNWPGIYFVSVAGHSNDWGTYDNHVLNNLPSEVANAVRRGKIKIVIDNSSEGMNMIFPGCDGFYNMHEIMEENDFHKNSVILMDGNADFPTNYLTWCNRNWDVPLFAHVHSFTHTFYFDNRIPQSALVINAIKNKDSKDFLSMNRNTRPSRLEHLFWLLDTGYVSKGLVSGSLPQKEQVGAPSRITLQDENLWNKTLLKGLPLDIDGVDCKSDPDKDATIFNHALYENSLLSVVTETAFAEEGMFITEKVMKPIAAGHPFMILGQFRVLKYLRSLGYKTDFEGIDQSYDEILNPYERFQAFHKSLENWIKLTRAQKEDIIMENLNKITYNQNLFRSTNYNRDTGLRLMTTVQNLFNNKYTINEKN